MGDWLKDSVFYEVYPQSFFDSNGDGIGDLRGIMQKLDYIKSLGCNAVWLNPIYDSPFMDAGYDVRDHCAVAPRYGTMDDLSALLDRAHQLGMRLLLDLVPGHTSDTHPWFKAACRAEKNEFSDRYIFTDCVWEAPTEHRLVCGVTERDGNYLVNYFSTQPALNYGFYDVRYPAWQKSADSPQARATVEALKEIMRFWLDKGFDGFRVDMADSLVKNDDEKIATAAVWRDIRRMMDEEYPDARLVSEWSAPYRAIRNAGFHADFYLDHWDNGYHYLFRDMHDGDNTSFFADHAHGDISRFLEDYLPAYACSSELGYISFMTNNHDMPRAPFYMSEEIIRLMHAFIMTMPGVPFVYYGDEIGMRYRTDLVSKEGGYSRTGSRTPMQWNSGKNCGFSAAEPSMLYLPVDERPDAPTVENQQGKPGSIYENLKALIALRNREPQLRNESGFDVIYAQSGRYPFGYRRGQFAAFVNPSDDACTIDYAAGDATVAYLIGDYSRDTATLTIGARSFVLLKES